MTKVSDDKDKRNSFTSMYRPLYFSIVGLLFLGGLLLMVVSEEKLKSHHILGDILRDIGGFIAAAVASHFIYEILLKREHEKILIEKLESLLNEQNSSIQKTGIIGASENISSDTLAKSIHDAKESVWILQSWIGDWNRLEKSMFKAVEKGISVRILLIDPNSPHATTRSVECGKDADWVSAGVRGNLRNLVSLSTNNGNLRKNLQVRIYDGTAVFCAFGCEDVAYVGFMRRGGYNVGATVLTLNMHDSSLHFSNLVKQHFDLVWGTARQVDFSNDNWKSI